MSDDMERERIEWIFAPVAIAALLTAGMIAGVVRGLRHGGHDECGGIPLPRCRWLTSRWAVRIAAWCALTAGLADGIIASNCFLRGWHDDVPPNLLSLVLATYVLLAAALVIGVVGLKWRDMPQVHTAIVQVTKTAGLGGLAAGLASEVLCESGEPDRLVSLEWRKGCATLGASAGLLLLGIYCMQADSQEASLPVLVRSQTDVEEEDSVLRHIRPRWPSWHNVDFPTVRLPSLRSADLPQSQRPCLSNSDFLRIPPDRGLASPLLMPPEALTVSARAPRDLPPTGLDAPAFVHDMQPSSSKAARDSLPIGTPSTCASPTGNVEETDVEQPNAVREASMDERYSQAWRSRLSPAGSRGCAQQLHQQQGCQAAEPLLPSAIA